MQSGASVYLQGILICVSFTVSDLHSRIKLILG